MSSGPRANWWDNAYRAWLVSAANGTKVAPRAHFDHNRAVFLEQGEFCSGIAVERQLLGACCRAPGALTVALDDGQMVQLEEALASGIIVRS